MCSLDSNSELNNENISEIVSQEQPRLMHDQRSIIDPSTELGSKYIYTYNIFYNI